MSEEDKQPKLPEGRRVTKRKSSRETLYLKRQQLLKEMQDSEEVRPISVREQVDKLKASSQTGSESEGEESWGSTEKRKKGSPWMLWAILGLTIPVVLVGLMLLTNKPARRTINDTKATGLNFDVLSGTGKAEPQDWFVENSGEAFSKGLELLEAVSKESLTLEEIIPLMRNEQQAARLLAAKNNGNWPAFDTSEPTSLIWNYGSSGGAGFMTMSGQRGDFRDFRAYFVRDEGKVFFDFDATEGRSDISIVDLPKDDLVGSILLRCWVAKEPHFDARSDEKLFSWYQILAPNEVDFVWAYCKTGDPLDELLREKLNYGRLIGERKAQFRATIKVGNARGFRDDEFLFEEFLAEEWVLPIARE